MKVVWTDEASQQLEGIFAFMARSSELYAHRLVNKIVARADALGDFPEMGRNPERYEDPSIRELVVAPYIVVYYISIGGNRTHILCLEDRNPKPLDDDCISPCSCGVFSSSSRRLHLLEQSGARVLLTPCVQGCGAEGQVSHPRLTSEKVHLAVRRLLHGGFDRNRTCVRLFTRQLLEPT
jgi:toxin ParE1/3/4